KMRRTHLVESEADAMGIVANQSALEQIASLTTAAEPHEALIGQLVLCRGLTIAQALRLQVSDVRPDGLIVEDKRGQPRLQALDPEQLILARALAGERRSGPLFVNSRGTVLTPDHARRMLFALAAAAGVELDSVHAMRPVLIRRSSEAAV